MCPKFERVSAAVVFMLACLGLVTGAMAGNKPVPLINQPLVPDAVAPGGPAFTLTVNGTGFVSKSRVYWNGSKRTTTVVSHSQLTASISARDIATAGTASVTVVNPAPTGGTSNVVFLSITDSTSTVGFRLESSPTTGLDPSSVAVADFNGDGKLDLAVTNWSSDTVSIFLGDGTGKFTLASSPSAGSEPVSVAVGDFNGDGKPDLAVVTCEVGHVCGRDTSSVFILLGDGMGNFTFVSSSSVGISASDVVAGDFNGDGRLDLAVTNCGTTVDCGTGNGTVSILLGDGTGNFTLASTPTTGQLPHSIAVGDFNGDGNLDLVVANSDDRAVSILLGDGTGNFTLASSPATGGFPDSVAVGDFNGDGNLDIATANDGTISVLLGDGSGNFTLVSSPEVGGYFITSGDFNGDGKLDLAVAPPGSGMVSILLGDGTGNFNLAASAASGVRSVAAGDFNGDGKLDFATMGTTGDTVSIFLQAPAVAFSPGTLNFGSQMVGTSSASQTVTLTNVGYAAVSISGVTIAGYDPGDFSETNYCPSSLAVGASCMITVVFSPVTGNIRTATLSVSDDGGNNPPTISLTGVGLSVVLSPASLKFGNVAVGKSSQPQTVVLTNIGSTGLGIHQIIVKGMDPDDFTEINTCGTHVGAGKSCNIVVTFAPTQTGSRTAIINIFDSAGEQHIKLSGTGT